ncbi:hypothetical protein DPSP01_013135 [Paraphaeosphaeria sporulosa]
MSFYPSPIPFVGSWPTTQFEEGLQQAMGGSRVAPLGDGRMEKVQWSRDEQFHPIFILDKHSAIRSPMSISALARILSELRYQIPAHFNLFSTWIAQLQEAAPTPSFDDQNIEDVLTRYLDSTIDIRKKEGTLYGKAMKVTGKLITYGRSRDNYILVVEIQNEGQMGIEVCPQEYRERITSIEHHYEMAPPYSLDDTTGTASDISTRLVSTSFTINPYEDAIPEATFLLKMC